MLIIYYLDIDINISTSIIKHFDTLLPKSCLNLNNDTKSIIAKHLSRDYTISTMLISKHYDLQKNYLESLYLITIFIKTKQHMIVFQMMMILIMVKNI